jgi:hypothetical protein
VIWTEVEVAAVGAGDRTAAGVVIRSSDGTPLDVLARAGPSGSRQGAVYRGVLAGLLRARRLGARAVRVVVHDPEVVGQLAGQAEIPSHVLGLYLQVRALLNAYRRRDVRYLDSGPSVPAVEAARRLLDADSPADGDDDVEPLPLWRMAAG